MKGLIDCLSTRNMKEDQTQLIIARLEHLQFLMRSGKMPIFRHRSDMFLFALEAYNIARGLSSHYYRLQENLDIRFFVHFPFDYWLNEIKQWIDQLGGAEYRVEDVDFFAEARAKRLTIVVDRLFDYHTDKLPADSAQGSMQLPDSEILEPFRKIMQMHSTDLVTSYSKALQDVYTYLERLYTMPLDWTEEKRHEALQLYLADAANSDQVKGTLADYCYFCRMPQSKTVQAQFCYLKELLVKFTIHDEFKGLNLSKYEQQQLLFNLQGLFGKDETHPNDDEIPTNAKPMADDVLLAKFLYFVDFSAECRFPVIDMDKVFNYLIRKDVILTTEQEYNLQALFALMGAMQAFFSPVLTKRCCSSQMGNGRQERIRQVLNEVERLNAKLSALVDFNHSTDEIDTFFNSFFAAHWQNEYSQAQDDLLHLFEKDRTEVNLKSYIRMLRVAADCLHVFKPTKALGKKIYGCLKDETIMSDVKDDATIQSYWSKQGYGVTTEENWTQAIRLIDAVKKEYSKKYKGGE